MIAKDTKLHPVGERLQQTEGAGPVGAGPLLHSTDDAPLEPDDDQRVEQEEDEEQQCLDQGQPHGSLAEVGHRVVGRVDLSGQSQKRVDRAHEAPPGMTVTS